MTNLIKDLLQNKYSLGSKVREKISPLFYSYGLNCSRHPYLLIALSFSLFCFCFYPIFGIHLFKNDFSQQFVTDLNTFRYCNNLSDDGSPANSNSTYANITSLKEKLRKAPQWVSCTRVVLTLEETLHVCSQAVRLIAFDPRTVLRPQATRLRDADHRAVCGHTMERESDHHGRNPSADCTSVLRRRHYLQFQTPNRVSLFLLLSVRPSKC